MGVFSFFEFIFNSLFPLIASSGDNLEAFLADFLADKYKTKLLKIIINIIAYILVENINSIPNKFLPNDIPKISKNAKIKIIPNIIPIGIEIIPIINASWNTIFRICFLVAPIDDNIPYCFIFSVIDISKLFLIQYTDVNPITNIIIPTTE